MLGTRRLAHSQNPQPQATSDFSDSLLQFDASPSRLGSICHRRYPLLNKKSTKAFADGPKSPIGQALASDVGWKSIPETR